MYEKILQQHQNFTTTLRSFSWIFFQKQKTRYNPLKYRTFSTFLKNLAKRIFIREI